MKDGNVTYIKSVAEQYIYEEELGEETVHYYKCTEDGDFEDSDEITEEEYNKIIKEFGKYNFYGISTDLTEINIDRYVK